MGDNLVGGDEWRSLLGALGWVHPQGLGLVVQDQPMVAESPITIVTEDELLRNNEVLLGSALYLTQLLAR